MKKHILHSIFIISLLSLEVCGQDAQFSQFYAAPLYANPAFTGGDHTPRLVLNYRNQWMNLDGGYVTYSGSFDFYAAKINSGFGVLVTQDQGNFSGTQVLDFSGLYAYEMPLNSKWQMRFGLQGGYTIRSGNFGNLKYPDQYNDQQGFTGAASNESISGGSIQYVNIGSGVLFYNEKAWIGLSLHNLTRPSLTNTGNSKLPIRYELQMGMNITLDNNPARWRDKYKSDYKAMSITPALNLKVQGGARQLDMGFYFNYSPFVVGLWYRGIPFISATDNTFFKNSDALIALAGFQMKGLRIGYSYDFTISKVSLSSGGTHEVSVMVNFLNEEKYSNKKKARPGLPCPKY